MKSRLQQKSRHCPHGFTLIELAICIAIIAILTTFACLSFGTAEEDRDAAMVQSAQATLQTIVSQGATRLDVSPQELRDSHSDQVLLAVQGAIGQSGSSDSAVEFSQSGGKFTMTIPQSNRTATFTITNNGEVQLSSLGSGFPEYEIINGIIHKK